MDRLPILIATKTGATKKPSDGPPHSYPDFTGSFALLKKARRTAIGLMCAAVLTTVSACGLLGGTTAESTSTANLEKTDLILATQPTVDLAPFWLAQRGGFFEREGLKVEGIDAAKSDAVMTKVISGEVDLGLTTYTNVFVANSKGQKLQLVADATSASPKSNALLTVPNSSVKTVQDLAGKRIGVSSRLAASGVLTRARLAEHGIDITKVQLLDMPLPNVAAALQAGDIDAGYQPEPMLTQASKTVGAYPVVDVADGGTRDFPLTVYTGTEEWVKKNPKTMAAFQRAMLAATLAAADRGKIEPLIVEHTKVPAETAALMTLPTFGSILNMNAQRVQRVPDLLYKLGDIKVKMDAAPMIAPQITP